MKLSCVRKNVANVFFSVLHCTCALNWTATRCWLRLTFLPQGQLHADTPPWKMHIVLISSGKLTVDCPLWSSCSCTTSSIFQVARVCPGYDGSHLLKFIAVGGYPDLTTFSIPRYHGYERLLLFRLAKPSTLPSQLRPIYTI